MSEKFGLGWKRHDARRMAAMMLVMNETRRPADAPANDGRATFR
jgi:hypothetical protein